VLAARAARAQGSLSAPLPQETAPAWTVGATCYELFVRSFKDSDGDGIGDLNGLISKLDYINDGNPRSTRSLGARCIWLMPVDESPSYHGYDVSDYYRVARALGTNDDFKRMVAAAHDRGIRVLVDLVLNHSSDQHPHFQEALRDSASPYRAWYRWSPTDPGRGPWGSDIWHKSPLRDEYYYGIFSSHMPDLNYETPAVLEEAKHVAEYWLDSMHVDGFRFDLAAALARSLHDVDQLSAFFMLIHQDPTLSQIKMIAEPWDVGPGGYQVGNFPTRWAEWNGRYRDAMRAFWRGDGTWAAAGAGTVTSVATNHGLTGGTITGSGTIGIDVSASAAGQVVGKRPPGSATPSSTSATCAKVATSRVNQPQVSKPGARSSTPFRLTRPCVGRRPTSPQ